MKTLASFLALLVLLTLTGCGSLPSVNATKFTYDSSYPIGGTSIDARDIRRNDTTTDVGFYKRITKLWGFSQTVTLEGLSIPRTAPAGGNIPAP